jgi:hypothetical protein
MQPSDLELDALAFRQAFGWCLNLIHADSWLISAPLLTLQCKLPVIDFFGEKQIMNVWFFFEMGDVPQPLHQKDTYDCFITLFKFSFNLITTQVSCLVDMKINQRKKNKAKDKAASHSDPMIKPPPTSAEEIPCYRLHPYSMTSHCSLVWR